MCGKSWIRTCDPQDTELQTYHAPPVFSDLIVGARLMLFFTVLML